MCIYDMSAHPLLKVEIAELSISERIQLAEELWDSILENSEELPLTDAQQQELDRRLEQYNQNPSLGTDWNTIKSRLGFGNEL
jgi:putative addiction module component (TIGR02574 family)